MKKIIIAILALIPLVAAAQPQAIELSTKHGRKNTVSIDAKLNEPGIYTVYLYFDKLINFDFKPSYLLKMVDSDQTLLTMKIVDYYQEASAIPKCHLALGFVVKSAPKDTHPYLLPVSTHKDGVKVFCVDPAARSATYNQTLFLMEKSDTIFAVRKGTVTQVIDGKQESRTDSGAKRGRNQITVQHKDGTYAVYNNTDNGSCMVKQGDTVYPHTPLAKPALLYNGEYGCYFDIMYTLFVENEEKPFIKEYVDPRFFVKDGLVKIENSQWYYPTLNYGIMTSEMTDQEKEAFNADPRYSYLIQDNNKPKQ